MLTIIVCVAMLCASFSMFYSYAINIPQRKEIATGGVVYSNQKAEIDASNLSQGFISVKYTGGRQVKIMMQITKTGGATYTYALNNEGKSETFALTEGSGAYTVKVLQNTTGTKYAVAFSQSITLDLDNQFAPFLYPNQYVNFTEDGRVAKKGAELTKGKKTDLEKLTAIYNYVIKNFTYDVKLAQTVQSGYLPDVDKVLEAKKGICFDYAAVMASMLRLQNVPCKLVVGYAGTIYHAWINVYIEDVGWVEKAVYFDGKSWSLMDPTFASSGKGDPKVSKYISDGTNYKQKFAY